ncbi:MAG: glycosyltransferase [Oscillospiraceae bacterium]
MQQSDNNLDFIDVLSENLEKGNIDEAALRISEAFDRLGNACTISALARKYWYTPEKIAELLPLNNLKYTKRTDGPKVIAAYYRNIKNGGAQRVAAELCNIWGSIKNQSGEAAYKVILLTDEPADDNDYEINANVKRVVLPDRLSACENYADRFAAWEKVIADNKIDIVVSGMWVDRVTFWDMLAVKSQPSHPAFIVHEHCFCAVPYTFEGSTAYSISCMYRICDGVVALTECDARYAGCFAPCVIQITNPLTLPQTEVTNDNFSSHTLVWCGRFSKEKNPLDMIEAMKNLVEKYPDAVVYMVGSGNDDTITERINSSIKEYHLEKNIILTGFTKTPEVYYKKAAAFVTTSSYEGLPLTHFEALSYKLPVVGYDLPWLPQFQDGRGIVAVEQGSPGRLADAIAELFENPDRIKKMGEEGYELLKEIQSEDISEKWNVFFNQINDEQGSKSDDNKTVEILLKYITMFQNSAKEKIREKLKNSDAEKKNLSDKLEKAYEDKSELKRKLQKTYDEKSEINEKLQRTYKEKSELNKKLQKAYEEKSEINRKLQITYQEKAERGRKISELEEYKAMYERTFTYKLKKLAKKILKRE